MLQAVDRPKKTVGQTARRVTLTQVGQSAPARVAADGVIVTLAAPTLPSKQTPAPVTPAVRRKRHYTPRARRCAYCGESFQPERKTARFCCPAHRQAAYRQRQQKRRPAPPPPVIEACTCARCGTGYFADPAHPSVWCSPRCKHAAWRERRAAAAPVVATITRCSLGKAADVIDQLGLAAVTAQLEALGLHYDARALQWG
jgi:hypothetical protein